MRTTCRAASQAFRMPMRTGRLVRYRRAKSHMDHFRLPRRRRRREQRRMVFGCRRNMAQRKFNILCGNVHHPFCRIEKWSGIHHHGDMPDRFFPRFLLSRLIFLIFNRSLKLLWVLKRLFQAKLRICRHEIFYLRDHPLLHERFRLPAR